MLRIAGQLLRIGLNKLDICGTSDMGAKDMFEAVANPDEGVLEWINKGKQRDGSPQRFHHNSKSRTYLYSTIHN